jgi:hypothetical protein
MHCSSLALRMCVTLPVRGTRAAPHHFTTCRAISHFVDLAQARSESGLPVIRTGTTGIPEIAGTTGRVARPLTWGQPGERALRPSIKHSAMHSMSWS